MNDLDFHPRAQLYEKSNFGVHFLQDITVDLDEIRYVSTICWLVKANAEFIWYK